MGTTCALCLFTALKHLNGMLIAGCNDDIILIKHERINVCAKTVHQHYAARDLHTLLRNLCICIWFIVFLQHFYEMYNSFVRRRSLCSSYVWHLRQTSSAFYSSLSNGCFSPPAPTYGSSMSGTQVSPTSILCQPTAIFTSKHQYTSSAKFQKCWFFVLVFLHSERGVCLPTVSLWILFVYIEAAIRFKDLKNFHVDLCRPFAAHW